MQVPVGEDPTPSADQVGSVADLKPANRFRLVGALVVLSVLAVMCAVGIGVQLHNRSETLDSLEHWRERELEERALPKAERARGFDAPASRIRRLESELDAIPERLLPMGLVLTLSVVLTVLGWRKLRRRSRSASR